MVYAISVLAFGVFFFPEFDDLRENFSISGLEISREILKNK